jgi:hypothetical protein
MYRETNHIRYCHVFLLPVKIGFRLVIGFTEHLQDVITNNYGILTELHTPNIISVFPNRCSVAATTVDVHITLGSRTVTGTSYQFLT